MKRALPYLGTAALGLLAAALILFSKNVGTLTDPPAIYSAFCDAFFVPGILIAGVGVLCEVAGTDFFDIFSYGIHSLVVLFTPLRKAEKHTKYYDFKLEREALRKAGVPHFLLFTGLGFILAAGICLLLYALSGGM